MRAAAKARSRYGQKKVVGDKEQFAWFCKGWNQLRLRIQNGGKGKFLSFPQFLFNNDEGRGWGSGIGVKHQSL
jgi:hypothetical protein